MRSSSTKTRKVRAYLVQLEFLPEALGGTSERQEHHGDYTDHADIYIYAFHFARQMVATSVLQKSFLLKVNL